MGSLVLATFFAVGRLPGLMTPDVSMFNLMQGRCLKVLKVWRGYLGDLAVAAAMYDWQRSTSWSRDWRIVAELGDASSKERIAPAIAASIVSMANLSGGDWVSVAV